jgi:hypothetical protein
LSCGEDGKINGFNQYRVGLNAGAFASDITFGGKIDPYIERRSVSASFEYHPNLDSTFSFGAGAGLGGRMDFDNAHAPPTRVSIDPGWLLSFAYSRRLMNGLGSKPFMLLSFSGGFAGAATHLTEPAAPGPSEQLLTGDIRAGLTVGKTFFRTISPYGSLRVFGGPIIWKYQGKSELGTDTRHVQIAAGMVTSLPKNFDLFAEVAPLFERGVTIGAGKSF